MKVIDLEPDQLPLIIRLRLLGTTKEYVLLKTRQDKLLLNKPNGDEQKQSR
jgi:hypothetical protein